MKMRFVALASLIMVGTVSAGIMDGFRQIGSGIGEVFRGTVDVVSRPFRKDKKEEPVIKERTVKEKGAEKQAIRKQEQPVKKPAEMKQLQAAQKQKESVARNAAGNK